MSRDLSLESIKYQIYGVKENGEMKWNISSNIEVDLAYWNKNGQKELFVISPAVSVGNALSLKACLENSTKKASKLFFLFFNRLLDGSKKGEIDLVDVDFGRRLMNCDSYKEYSFSHVMVPTSHVDFEGYKKEYQVWKHYFAESFGGKLLLLNEAFFFLSQREEITKETIATLFQTAYLLEELTVDAGVHVSPGKGRRTEGSIRCNRCGSTEQIILQNCGLCNELCATCENCIALGRSKTCTPIYHFPIIKYKSLSPKVKATLRPVQLNKYQQEIADTAVTFLTAHHQREILIWAVTGAGKTEMIFPAIAKAFEQGQRVVLTSPRKDVIKELTPRFKAAFPNSIIVSLYGGSEERWNNGNLFLATTHQLIRFVDYFDVIIIDEMDAYPFHNNRMLQGVVQRALRAEGKFIYMTATPSESERRRVERKELLAAILPVRYHLHPIPVPHIEMMTRQEKILYQKEPCREIARFIEEVKRVGGQGFIFLPSVKDVRLWLKKLMGWFPNEGIRGVYANNPERDQMIEEFRKGEIRFLVTTTILERGVTVPNVHVLVIKADSNIFDEATLVQIAGRTGRSSVYPNGIVWFLSENITNAMVSAKKHVQGMNKLSEKVIKVGNNRAKE